MQLIICCWLIMCTFINTTPLDYEEKDIKENTWNCSRLALKVKVTDDRIRKLSLTQKLKHEENIFSKTGKYLVPIFPHCLIFALSLHSYTSCTSLSHKFSISSPRGSHKLSFGYQCGEIWLPVYIEDGQKWKWERRSAHKQYTASVSSCSSPGWKFCVCTPFISGYIRYHGVQTVTICVFSADSSLAFSSSLVLWFLMIVGALQRALCLGKQANTN